MYAINPQHARFDDLTFDNDERLISRQQIYSINCDIV